jgi:hypothetical protein
MINKSILDEIQNMGYLTLQPISISHSYYKLKDGTIIEAYTEIESVVEAPNTPTGYVIRTKNNSVAYVPKNVRQPQNYSPFSPIELQSGILEEEIDFETLQEEYTVYELSNGMQLSIKAVVSQIGRTKFFTIHGEPVYSTSVSPITKLKRNP